MYVNDKVDDNNNYDDGVSNDNDGDKDDDAGDYMEGHDMCVAAACLASLFMDLVQGRIW